MQATLWNGAMVGFKLAQPLTSATSGFTIGLLIPQPANQTTHLLLTIANRTLQTLPSQLLLLRRVFALLLPALKELLMQQFSPSQECSRIFRRGLLALPLLFQTTDHSVDIAIPTWLQQLPGLFNHAAVKTKTRCDRQRIAASWNPPKQLIRRRKGIAIKGHRSVFKA